MPQIASTIKNKTRLQTHGGSLLPTQAHAVHSAVTQSNRERLSLRAVAKQRQHSAAQPCTRNPGRVRSSPAFHNSSRGSGQQFSVASVFQPEGWNAVRFSLKRERAERDPGSRTV